MKILLADDHVIVRDGIKVLLMDAFPFVEITEVGSGAELLEVLPNTKWDLIISDITMPPGDSGLESISLIKEQLPRTPIIILSMHTVEHYAVRAIKAGASGYINKREASQELVKAIRHVLGGKKYFGQEVMEAMADSIENDDMNVSINSLSNRELEVFKLIATGKDTREIANLLDLSPNTVSTFRSRIFEKMHFRNNADLIVFAVAQKII